VSNTSARSASEPLLRSYAAYRLAFAALVALLVLSLATCGDGIRHVQMQDRAGTGISLTTLWLDVAMAAEADPQNVALESMSLELSDTGRLQRAVIDGVTERDEHLQVFMSGKKAVDVDPLQCGVSIYPPDPTWPNRAVCMGLPLFQAMDRVGISTMIAVMPPAGQGGFYTFRSAYGMASPQQPISPSAPAYRWDGERLVGLPPDDELREFPDGYQYVAGLTAELVSTSSTDNTITWQHQGSGEPVYFVIPTPRN
jgi:hypothetical protein